METISAKELDRYVQDKRYQIVDLRTRREYLAGHIRGAANVPQGRFEDELQMWGDKILILYCARGGLSMTVARDLEREGYRTVSVVGGFQAYRGCGLEFCQKNLTGFRS